MRYIVNLISGDVETYSDEIRPKWLYKRFSNEHQAGYFALGICLQNISENAVKNNVDVDTLVVDFNLFGATHTLSKEQAIKGREILKHKYAEYFI